MPRTRTGRASVVIATAPVRVAAYCRVSTDERLGQAFNSLHAQREAGENDTDDEAATYIATTCASATKKAWAALAVLTTLGRLSED